MKMKMLILSFNSSVSSKGAVEKQLRITLDEEFFKTILLLFRSLDNILILILSQYLLES